jgi:hypothetical protein
VGLGASATKTTTTELNTPNSVPTTKLRYPHWVQLADHDRVPRLLELGWEKSTGLIDTNKGMYGCIMVWPHETEPPNE